MSLREQLRARERPSLDYELPIGDAFGAKRDLAAAEDAHRQALRLLAKAATDTDGAVDEEAAQAAVAETRQAVAQAEQALDACYVHIKLVAMPPDEYEALVALHPPRPGTDDKEWNGETFPKAVFLACATELTPEEWEPILAQNLTHAEREDLYYLARVVNLRLVNHALPKGSKPIPSF